VILQTLKKNNGNGDRNHLPQQSSKDELHPKTIYINSFKHKVNPPVDQGTGSEIDLKDRPKRQA
jgi:hypothetical protein